MSDINGYVEMPNTGARIAPGYFGVIAGNQPIRWYHCRENFHTIGDPERVCKYFYGHTPNNVNGSGKGTDVANFIYHLENCLGLVNKSSFHYTQDQGVCCVQMAAWWADQRMRCNFFSMALRASLLWNRQARQDMRTVLLMQPYAATTVNAVDRFLGGCTHYTGNIVGWHRSFTGYYNGNVPPTVAQLNALLVKPIHTDKERYEEIQKMAYYEWEKQKQISDAAWKRAENKYRGIFFPSSTSGIYG